MGQCPDGGRRGKTLELHSRREMLDGLRQTEHGTPPLGCSLYRPLHTGALAVEGSENLPRSKEGINSATGDQPAGEEVER